MIFFVFVSFYICASFFLINLNHAHNLRVFKVKQGWINQNKKAFTYIYTNTFDKAKSCGDNVNCEFGIRQEIDKSLGEILSLDKSGLNRMPVYFIRLNSSGDIEKLYQGGGYHLEKVDTKGERMVREMLKGNRNPFGYPQYNCCGGDDIVADIPIVNKLLPPRRYLNDFYSEIEQIYLIKDDSNNILGGLVYLYGD